MRFEELSKMHQEFLMYCLSDYIKSKIKKGTMDGIIFPSYDEYKAFFNEFDEGYEIVDGLPESEACNPFLVKFKVLLEVDGNHALRRPVARSLKATCAHE